MFRIICILIGYFLGCVQSAYIVGKIGYKIDIRHFGSGNAGSTNVLRTLGKKAAIIVFTSDVIKSIVAFFMVGYIFGENNINSLAGMYAGAGVIIGHTFPFYMKFKGGKGVASILGLMLVVNYKAALICYLVGILVICIFRYVSLSSLVMVVLYPILLYFFKVELEIVLVTGFLSIMIYFKHIENIKRLLNKTERKITGGDTK